ncbi:HNH endonuclease signature motif containing protein [Leucobacter chromiireducens]|uniref:HNH endonuclease n=1 Tax=Leucobacter chromiireducens subsp. chromiireducens TaxID=660067 RepID=A0ABS1SKU7_9MICO|nr:HNH endonuclease signature motif containing protein [Leucobacter chromiireducens]MBL3688792.1 HNH endonuclease [Leucobacter chromiireducens subsp. chromiireducens]
MTTTRGSPPAGSPLAPRRASRVRFQKTPSPSAPNPAAAPEFDPTELITKAFASAAPGVIPPVFSVRVVDDVVGMLEQFDRFQSILTAARLNVLSFAMETAVHRAPSGSGDIPYRSLRAEIATALHQSEHIVERDLNLASALTMRFPATLPRMLTGQVSPEHVRALVESADALGLGQDSESVRVRGRYEAEVLRRAESQTPQRLRPIARKLARELARTLPKPAPFPGVDSTGGGPAGADQSSPDPSSTDPSASDPVSTDPNDTAPTSTDPSDTEPNTGAPAPSPECERRVWVRDHENGMAELVAFMPTPVAYAIHDRLTRLAKSAEVTEHQLARTLTGRDGLSAGAGIGTRTRTSTGTGAGEESPAHPTRKPRGVRAQSVAERRRMLRELRPGMKGGRPGVREIRAGIPKRSRAQTRTDVFRDLLLAGDPMRLVAGSPEEAVRAHIQVVVTTTAAPASANAGPVPGARPAGPTGTTPTASAPPEFTDAELIGSGPIDPEQIRGYAGHADFWEKVTVSGESGDVLSVDRYRPSAQMRRFLGARDLHCRFPGCRVPVNRCDIDHTIPAADGGTTSTDNLAHLCRGHHTMKHNSDWDHRLLPDGTMRWRSPTGRVYDDEPPSRVRFLKHENTGTPPPGPSATRSSPPPTAPVSAPSSFAPKAAAPTPSVRTARPLVPPRPVVDDDPDDHPF